MTAVADRRMLVFTCSFLGIFLPMGMAVEAGGTPLLLLPAVGLPLIVTGLWVYVGVRYKSTTVGRGRTRRSAWARRAAGLVGYDLTPCGCTYSGHYRDRKPDADVVEESPIWLRKCDGKRLRFRKATEALKRCHRCGQHYHATDVESAVGFSDRSNVKRECWPEEEPEIVAELDAPVRDRAEVES